MFTESEAERYSRQTMLPDWGNEVQVKLKDARVFIAGLGGLGSPVALYLAAAGVGHLGLLDKDVVELSNLQRQLLHGTTDIKRAKTDSAEERLKALNPTVSIDTFNLSLTEDNAPELIKDYDLVIDCLDQLKNKYMLNRACVFTGKPLIHGGIDGFTGHLLSTIIPGHTPCLNCVFPEELFKGSEERTIPAVGPVAGVIGSMMAMEAIDYILEAEKEGPFLLRYDGRKQSTRRINLPGKDNNCSICNSCSFNS